MANDHKKKLAELARGISALDRALQKKDTATATSPTATAAPASHTDLCRWPRIENPDVPSLSFAVSISGSAALPDR
jgi:hypothetical protein